MSENQNQLPLITATNLKAKLMVNDVGFKVITPHLSIRHLFVPSTWFQATYIHTQDGIYNLFKAY